MHRISQAHTGRLESNSPLSGLLWYSFKCQQVSKDSTGNMYKYREKECRTIWEGFSGKRLGRAAPHSPALQLVQVMQAYTNHGVQGRLAAKFCPSHDARS